ncbi:MAG TPA: tripartite tricarboxylate transporter substrate binding protein [Candidatus Microbacterium pullistercoris]|nr:tripartite tricarboxylate transporter substrate binding protein [Candidatus Microbacterium pullistercoris]
MTQHTTGRRRILALGAVAATTALMAACAGGGGGGGGDSAVDSLAVVAPADPGGGWDQTARSFAQAANDEGIVSSAPVTNIGGAGGTVGLASLATESNPHTLMITGSVMVGAVETNASEDRIEDMTPIARLTEEPLVLVVPADSPYENIGDFVDAWIDGGSDMAVTGGSAGGIDHILAGLLLLEGGLTATEVPDALNYIANSGGGEAVTLLLGGQVDAGISGVAEFSEQVASGDLRALAVSSGEPAELLPEVPTFVDEGIDVTLTNWRGLIAPGDISDEDRTALEDVVQNAHDSDAWAETLETNGWTDAFLVGDEFDTFLADDIATTKETLATIGLLE